MAAPRPNHGHVAAGTSAILHFEHRAILRPRLSLIIHPRRRNIRVPQPLLYLGDVGVVRQGIGRGGGTERVHAQAGYQLGQAHLAGVALHDILIDGRRMQLLVLTMWYASHYHDDADFTTCTFPPGP